MDPLPKSGNDNSLLTFNKGDQTSQLLVSKDTSNDNSFITQSYRQNNMTLSSNFLNVPKDSPKEKPLDILKSHESLREQIRQAKQKVSQHSSNLEQT